MTCGSTGGWAQDSHFERLGYTLEQIYFNQKLEQANRIHEYIALAEFRIMNVMKSFFGTRERFQLQSFDFAEQPR